MCATAGASWLRPDATFVRATAPCPQPARMHWSPRMGSARGAARLAAGDAVGEFAQDVEVAIVPGGLLNQVDDDVPQSNRLAGVPMSAHRLRVPIVRGHYLV